MRKINWHHVLGITGILGDIVIGMTILTSLFQEMPIDRIFIGVVLIAIGVIDFSGYFTLKIAAKFKSIQIIVSSLVMLALGIVFIAVNMTPQLFCILWGSFAITFAITKIATGLLNISSQPLLYGVRIILSIIAFVLSIILIVRAVNYLNTYVVFVGVSLLIEAVALVIEFIVHLYQK